MNKKTKQAEAMSLISYKNGLGEPVVHQPYIRAFEDGWDAAMEEAANRLKTAWSNPRYSGREINVALEMLAEDLKTGEE